MGETRWLGEEERQAWIGLSMVVTWLPQALDAQLVRDSDLSHAEYQVLSWLSMAPARSARMGAIAELSHLNASHLSRVAARLEGRGLLRREPDPEDGRATLATLTPEGWDAVVAAAPGHVENVRRLVFDALDAEQVARLNEISRAIASAIRPGVARGCQGGDAQA